MRNVSQGVRINRARKCPILFIYLFFKKFCKAGQTQLRTLQHLGDYKLPSSGSLPSVESFSRMLRLSWSCSLLTYVIPVHSSKHSVSCIATLGTCLSSVSGCEHLISPATSSSGDTKPKDSSTMKYLDILFLILPNCRDSVGGLGWSGSWCLPMEALLFSPTSTPCSKKIWGLKILDSTCSPPRMCVWLSGAECQYFPLHFFSSLSSHRITLME